MHFWVKVLKILGYEDSSSEGVTSKWDATRTIRSLGRNMELKKVPCEGVLTKKIKTLTHMRDFRKGYNSFLCP